MNGSMQTQTGEVERKQADTSNCGALPARIHLALAFNSYSYAAAPHQCMMPRKRTGYA
jgi:hypothetical protein